VHLRSPRGGFIHRLDLKQTLEVTLCGVEFEVPLFGTRGVEQECRQRLDAERLVKEARRFFVVAILVVVSSQLQGRHGRPGDLLVAG